VSGRHHAPDALPPENRAGTHCTGGWLGQEAALDVSGKSRLRRGSNPETCNP